jgi:hypothetical protein
VGWLPTKVTPVDSETAAPSLAVIARALLSKGTLPTTLNDEALTVTPPAFRQIFRSGVGVSPGTMLRLEFSTTRTPVAKS